jgi:phosphoserine phosphatase RsbU/P
MLTRNDVGEVLHLANQALCMDAADGRFVTLLRACIDPENRTLVYASAGHLPGYIFGENGEVRHELWSTGIPLGVEADTAFPASQAVELQTGDLALLMTDGIVEAANRQRSRFGFERALETVRQHRHLPPADIIVALHEAVQQFSAGSPADDLSAVIVKRVQ